MLTFDLKLKMFTVCICSVLQELVKKTSLSLSNSKHFLRLTEMEQTVAEQDNSLASLVGKLKKTTSDLEKEKQINLIKIKEFETIRAQ